MAPRLNHDSLPFLLVAWGVILAQLAGFRLGVTGELILLAIAAASGLPHGALDVLLLNRLPGRRRAGGYLIYTALALLVVASWYAAPGFTLAAFLLVAWFHFGGSDASGSPVPLIEGFARGGAPLVLPALFFHDRLIELFAMLIPPEEAVQIAELLGVAFWAWFLGFAAAQFHSLRDGQWGRSLELLTLAGLFGLVTPLVAFSIYFPLLHSLRSLSAIRRLFPRSGATRLIWSGLWPSLPVVAGALAGLLMLGEGAGALDHNLIKVIFVALAAVTLPHVLLWWLMERGKKSGFEALP